MKIVKTVLCIVFLVGLLGGWYRYYAAQTKISGEYAQYINAAQVSVQNGLYQQAIEY